MIEIKTAGIIGAGALGLLYMEALEAEMKENVYFLADQLRAESISETSYSINGKVHRFKAHFPLTGENPLDLIIVAVKNYNLSEISETIKTAAGPKTIIVSVLNGINSEAFLEDLCPDSTILYALALGMDAVKEERTINYSNPGKIVLGSRDNEICTPLKAVCTLLEKCNIQYRIPDDIHRELWYKWMINIGVNQVSAVTGAPYGLFQTDPLLQELMDNAMLETVLLAKYEGIDLRKSDLQSWHALLQTLGKNGKTSMLQDIEAHRQTELDSFAGELLNRGAKHGLKMPVNQTLYSIIKIKEQIR